MNADRALLELAAKAAGIVLGKAESGELFYDELLGCVDVDADEYWHPLDDDGQALRLAVKLGALVGTYAHYSTVDLLSPNERIETTTVWHHTVDGDACAATRRAIVRAAAAIGEAMP